MFIMQNKVVKYCNRKEKSRILMNECFNTPTEKEKTEYPTAVQLHRVASKIGESF